MRDDEFHYRLAAGLEQLRVLGRLPGSEGRCRPLAAAIMSTTLIRETRAEVDHVLRDMEVLRHLKVAALSAQERRDAAEARQEDGHGR